MVSVLQSDSPAIYLLPLARINNIQGGSDGLVANVLGLHSAKRHLPKTSFWLSEKIMVLSLVNDLNFQIR